jgi:hypothetical protein
MADIIVAGNTSGSITISAPLVSGSNTLTLPAVTDTIAGIAATQTLTNKTLTSPVLTTPALGTPASGNLANCTGIPAVAGSVLQVVSTTKTDTFSVAAPNFVDVTGLSVSITPASASNKILIHCSVRFQSSELATQGYRLVRNSTAICIGDAANLRPRISSGYLGYTNLTGVNADSLTFLDSPATTSATTYKIQAFGTYSGTWYLNKSPRDADTADYDGRTTSTITVMEIKG